jgi:hypothetical protein
MVLCFAQDGVKCMLALNTVAIWVGDADHGWANSTREHLSLGHIAPRFVNL